MVWPDTPSVAWREGCTMTETIEPMVKLDEVERHRFAQHLVDQARSEGGLFNGVTPIQKVPDEHAGRAGR
jgi:hypothetical protein